MQQINNTAQNAEIATTLKNFLKDVTRHYSLEVTAVELYKYWATLNHEAGGHVADYFKIDLSRTVTIDECIDMGFKIADDLDMDIEEMIESHNAPQEDVDWDAFMDQLIAG